MNIINNKNDNQIAEVLLHYKKFYFPLGIILVSAALLLFFILPQFQQYTDQQNEMREVKERINTVKGNLTYVATINDEVQGSDIQTVSSALPGEKDYAGILYAVRTASTKSGVSVGDFTFVVGNLSENKSVGKSLPIITMDLNVNGDLEDIGLFLSELSKIFPLSNVSEISVAQKFSKLVVHFYYKPIPSFKINYTNAIKPISAPNKKLLETLKKWQEDRPFYDILLPSEGNEASTSASPF